MRVVKKLDGRITVLEHEPIKVYASYTLYAVYKIVGLNRTYLYNECLSDIQQKYRKRGVSYEG